MSEMKVSANSWVEWVNDNGRVITSIEVVSELIREYLEANGFHGQRKERAFKKLQAACLTRVLNL